MAGRTQPKRKIWLILVVLLPVLLLAAGVWAIRLYGNASAPAAGYDPARGDPGRLRRRRVPGSGLGAGRAAHRPFGESGYLLAQ